MVFAAAATVAGIRGVASARTEMSRPLQPGRYTENDDLVILPLQIRRVLVKEGDPFCLEAVLQRIYARDAAATFCSMPGAEFALRRLAVVWRLVVTIRRSV